MANKWHGVIGFVDTVETKPGVWKEQITERKYYGDVSRNSRRWENGDKVNSDLTLSNTISILADSYANANFGNMRYLEYGGVKWCINNIEVAQPRLTLTIGGLYNAQ